MIVMKNILKSKLPLNKTVEILTMKIVVRGMRVYMNDYIDYEKKNYNLTKLTFLKELVLIKPVHQKSAIFVTIGIS